MAMEASDADTDSISDAYVRGICFSDECNAARRFRESGFRDKTVISTERNRTYPGYFWAACVYSRQYALSAVAETGTAIWSCRAACDRTASGIWLADRTERVCQPGNYNVNTGDGW